MVMVQGMKEEIKEEMPESVCENCKYSRWHSYMLYDCTLYPKWKGVDGNHYCGQFKFTDNILAGIRNNYFNDGA